MKIFNCIITLCILLVINGCGGDLRSYYADGLTIQNNSKDTLRCITSNLYPDTTIGDLYNTLRFFPDASQTMSILELNDKNYRHGVIEIFLFDNRVVQENSWSDIRTKYLVLKRYDLSLDSLKRMNNTVVYP